MLYNILLLTKQLQKMINMEEQGHRVESSYEDFKLMNGRDDTTTFLPLDFRIGGQSGDSCPIVGQYLTRDQTRYMYKKVEMGR